MPLLGRQTNFSDTLANMPKSGMRVGDVFSGTDPSLHSFRWNGTYWQTLATGSGVPLFDGMTHLSQPTYSWVATGAGTNEYACVLTSTGGNPSLTDPGSVYINNAEATEGTAGSLAAGTWGWGSYSGFNTVHVRLSDGTNPNTKFYGYVRSDPCAWVGGAGTATAIIESGVPLLSVNSGAGTNTLRTKQRAITTGQVFYCTPKIVPSPTATSGAGIAFSDGTKFRSLCVITDTVSKSLRLRAVNWDTNTTGFADLAIDIPAEYYMQHGDLMLAGVLTATHAQFFVGPHNSFARNVYQATLATHLSPTTVGPCVYTNNDTGRAWFPQMRLA